MASSAPLRTNVEREALSLGTFVATVVGNWLEFFDFGVYAFFAVMIGRVFFPVSSEAGQLLLSFTAFGVGFIGRPLGAVILGSYADHAGRRAALTVTILMMAVGTGMIAITPSYATIGVAAPVLIVVARCLQGFSAGGEVGVATSYLVEVAPRGRRGLYGSLQSATQGLASVAGAALGYGLSLRLSDAAMTSWGWRVPFALGVLIAPVGFVIRSQLPETVRGAATQRTSRDVIKTILTRAHVRPMVLGVLGIVGSTVATYVLGHYMTSYAMTVLRMPTSTAMLVSVVSGATLCVGAVLGGWASDRVGRRAIMILPRVVLLLALVPVFSAIIAVRTPAALIGGVAALMILQASSGAVFILALPECFPRSVRSLGVGVVYAVGVAIFGGSASGIATWLVTVTKDPLAPAWYVVVTNVVSLVALYFLRVPRPDDALD